MKKKILAVLLVLCAVMLFALTASAATDTSVGYRVNVTLHFHQERGLFQMGYV